MIAPYCSNIAIVDPDFLLDPTQLDKLHNGMPTDCAAHSLTEFFCAGLWCDWPCWAIFKHYMCFHPEFHLFLISRHGLVWTRIRLATTRLGPQDQSYGASLYKGEVCPSKLQYFLTKNIAAKATTCLRRRRVRIKCMSMNKCSIHCTSISQKIGLAQEVPYSSRTCSVYIRKYRQQVARCSPIQQSYWEVGCLQKTHCFSRSMHQNMQYFSSYAFT